MIGDSEKEIGIAWLGVIWHSYGATYDSRGTRFGVSSNLFIARVCLLYTLLEFSDSVLLETSPVCHLRYHLVTCDWQQKHLPDLFLLLRLDRFSTARFFGRHLLLYRYINIDHSFRCFPSKSTQPWFGFCSLSLHSCLPEILPRKREFACFHTSAAYLRQCSGRTPSKRSAKSKNVVPESPTTTKYVGIIYSIFVWSNLFVAFQPRFGT
jgi:hypothetical protein